MSERADAILQVRFKTTSEGGRKKSLRGGIFSCPLLIDGRGFDCRFSLGDQVVELGKTYELPVRFLSRDLIEPWLRPGQSFSLWEGKEIGSGIIKEVVTIEK